MNESSWYKQSVIDKTFIQSHITWSYENIIVMSIVIYKKHDNELNLTYYSIIVLHLQNLFQKNQESFLCAKMMRKGH